jgi:hypothetical protein
MDWLTIHETSEKSLACRVAENKGSSKNNFADERIYKSKEEKEAK